MHFPEVESQSIGHKDEQHEWELQLQCAPEVST